MTRKQFISISSKFTCKGKLFGCCSGDTLEQLTILLWSWQLVSNNKVNRVILLPRWRIRELPVYLDIMSLFWDDDHLEKYSLYGGRLWIAKSSVDFILFSFPVSCHDCSEKNISLRQQLYNDDHLNPICYIAII